MEKDNIHSANFKAGKRTYFLDVKKTKDGDKYIKICESKRTGNDEFDRHQIMVFQEDIDNFMEAVSVAVNKLKESEKNIKLDKSYSVADKRKDNANAYAPWTNQDDEKLESLYCQRKTVKEIAVIFGRNTGAIHSRIKKLELKDKYAL